MGNGHVTNGHLTGNGHIQGEGGTTYMPRTLRRISFIDSSDTILATKIAAGYGPKLDAILKKASEEFGPKYEAMK